jgi:DNA invertase Pin-like site-specific DNA recombinase
MKIGYARISTDDQNLNLQLDALKAAGCERLFTDTASGAKAERPGLAEALAFTREGDVLIVWRLDRLSRSLHELLKMVGELKKTGIGFESITDHIDTSSAAGELIFHVFGSIAQFERRLIIERTQAGLAAARSRGRQGGRPKVSEETINTIKALSETDKRSQSEICKALKISRSTFYKYAALAQSEAS